MLAPPWRVGAPSSGKSWIRHCYLSISVSQMCKSVGAPAEDTYQSINVSYMCKRVGAPAEDTIYLLVFPDRCELPRPHYHSHFVPKFISNIDDACVDIVQPYIGLRIGHVRTYRSTNRLNVRELLLRVLRKF